MTEVTDENLALESPHDSNSCWCKLKNNLTWKTMLLYGLIFAVLVSLMVFLILFLGRNKGDENKDDNKDVIPPNSQIPLDENSAELFSVNGTQIYGFKDPVGNIQQVYGVESASFSYLMQNSLINQIKRNIMPTGRSEEDNIETLEFRYNTAAKQYKLLFSNKANSFMSEKLETYSPVEFPKYNTELPDNANVELYNGFAFQLEEINSQRIVDDSIVSVNYKQGNATKNALATNLGGGAYFISMPLSEAPQVDYFDPRYLTKSLTEQSQALLELLQGYNITNSCLEFSDFPNIKQFCEEVLVDMKESLEPALKVGIKHAEKLPTTKKEYFEILLLSFKVTRPGENDEEFLINNNPSLQFQILESANLRASGITPYQKVLQTLKKRCNDVTVAGENTPSSQVTNLGSNHINVNFYYETYQIKDKIDVLYNDKEVFSSGCVGTNGKKKTNIRMDEKSTSLEVKVFPNCEGSTSTRWEYTIECPKNELICTKSTCTCDSNKPPKQLHPPTKDGCGTHLDWHYKYIHDKGESLHFTPFCDQHDICYSTCGSSRDTCDANFCNSMKSSCDPADTSCNNWADKFCLAVKILSSGAFVDAQKESCGCE